MNPTQVLRDEHRIILQVLDAMEARIDAIDGSAFPRAFFDEALDFLGNFAENWHRAKEERVLFPMLQARGLRVHGGPLGATLGEHDLGRTYLEGIREHLDAAESGSEGAAETVCEYAAQYAGIVREHIRREEETLFPFAEAALSPADTETLEAEFEKVKAPQEYGAYPKG